MAFTEETIYRVEVLPPYSNIAVRETLIVKEDGNILSTQNKRYMFHPGDDVSNFPSQDVKDVAEVIWTDKVIADFKAYYDTLYSDPLTSSTPGLDPSNGRNP